MYLTVRIVYVCICIMICSNGLGQGLSWQTIVTTLMTCLFSRSGVCRRLRKDRFEMPYVGITDFGQL